MRLTITNKLVSAGGSSTVVDEQGNDYFFVKGEWLSPSKKKWIRDLKKKKLFLVKNRLLHGAKRGCYIYDGSKNLVAEVNQIALFEQGFEVLGTKEPMALKPNGGAGLSFDIVLGGKLIGTIQSEFTVARDTFTLNVNDPEDAPFCTALVIAVDNIRDAIRKKNK